MNEREQLHLLRLQNYSIEAKKNNYISIIKSHYLEQSASDLISIIPS